MLWPFVVVVFEIVTMAVIDNEYYLCEDSGRMTTIMCMCSKGETTLEGVMVMLLVVFFFVAGDGRKDPG